MKGLMMDTPLMIGSIMDHAERNFPDQEIVSVVADQPDFRYTFKDAFQRTRQLGNALKSLGIDIGDRVGTLAWNDHRHFELYYSISSSGAICHTVNPRLFPEQLIYIAQILSFKRGITKSSAEIQVNGKQICKGDFLYASPDLMFLPTKEN